MPDDKPRDKPDVSWLGATQPLEGLAPRVGAPPVLGVKLVCVKGPNAGREFPLNQVEMVLGRAPENAINLADLSVSRSHATLRRTPAGWAVFNLGARYGTLVNGQELQGEAQRLLRAGDAITVGDTVLILVEPAMPGDTGVENVRTQEVVPPRPDRLGLSQGDERTFVTEPEIDGRTRVEGVLATAAPELENRTQVDGRLREGLGPLEDRTLVGSTLPGPPSEKEVTDRASLDSLPPSLRSPSGAVSGTRAMASPLSGEDAAGGQESTLNLPNPLNLSGASPAPLGERLRRVWQWVSRRGFRQEADLGQRPLFLAALTVLGIALGMGIVLLWNFSLAEPSFERRGDGPGNPALRGRAEALFRQGQELFRQGHFSEAKAKFQALHGLDPAFPVQDALARAEREVGNQVLLNVAKAALAQDQLGVTREWLAKVPPETAQAEELRRLKGALEARARARLRDARTALDARRLDEAVAIAEDVLKIFPGNHEAASVRADAQVMRAATHQHR